MLPDELRQRPSDDLRHDFENMLRSIGWQMSSLGDAVVALVNHDTNLLDASLENCKAALHEVLQGHSNLARTFATCSVEHDLSPAWVAEFANQKTSSTPLPKASKTDTELKSMGQFGEPVQANGLTEASDSPRLQESSNSPAPNLQESKNDVRKESTTRKSDQQFSTDFEKGTNKSNQPSRQPTSKVEADNSCAAKLREVVAKLMRSRKVALLVGTIIVANALVLGHQSDRGVQFLDEEPPIAYRVLDIFFLCAFTLELLLRVFADGPSYFFAISNKDRNWNLFDLMMVLSAMVDEIVALLAEGGSANMSAVRVLRILRLVRVIRLIRVMRVFQDLRLMVAGIVSCLKPLTWALCLICLLMYCFAVCILQFVAAEFQNSASEVSSIPEDLADNYGSLVLAMSTLYMSITGGIDWGDSTIPLFHISPVLGVFFYCYVAFAVFCCLNIVTGVFVENAHKMANRDEDHMIMQEMEKHHFWLQDVKRVFSAADKDGNAWIDIEEFREFQKDPRMQAFLRKLGVDWSMESSDRLFKQLDFDKTGTIEFDEFIMALQSLTGATRAMDMINLMHDAKATRHLVEQVMRVLQADRDDVASRISSASEPEFSFGNRRSTAMIRPIRQTMAENGRSVIRRSMPALKEEGKGHSLKHSVASNPQEHAVLPVAPSTSPMGTSFPHAANQSQCGSSGKSAPSNPRDSSTRLQREGAKNPGTSSPHTADHGNHWEAFSMPGSLIVD